MSIDRSDGLAGFPSRSFRGAARGPARPSPRRQDQAGGPRHAFSRLTLGTVDADGFRATAGDPAARGYWLLVPDTWLPDESAREPGTESACIVLRGPAGPPGPTAGSGERHMVLGFRADRVERALARRGRAAPEAPGAVALPLDRPPGSTLHSFARWVFHEFERAGSDEAFSPAFAAASERTLLAMLLECILGQPPLPHRRPELSGAQLTRIDGWIAEHARDDIGVRDIARAAGVSARTLRDGFREARGLTPKQALLHRRLQEARTMLLATGPDAARTVTQVALGCGFEHLGRFSRAYADAFGERPSQTLARARRGPGGDRPATTRAADGE